MFKNKQAEGVFLIQLGFLSINEQHPLADSAGDDSTCIVV